MNIVFIQTGGTIDKDYPRKTKGYAFEFGEPAVARIINQLNPSFTYKVISAFKKDSLDISEMDLEELAEIIAMEESDKIIITHGTDTMIHTGKFLLSRDFQKSIIITGALLPERFKYSNASFNIGCAIGAIQDLEGGVYICMNGVIKAVSESRRDLETGKFY